MSTLPQQTPRPRRNPDEPAVVRHLREHPGKAIDPFLPDYLHQLPGDTLLVPSEVGSLFRVDPKTVVRWANKPENGLPSIRTPGGHRRFRVDAVRHAYTKSSHPDAGR